MELNRLSETVLGAAFKVHSALGPGLLENAYEICLEHELKRQGLAVSRQHPLALHYEDLHIESAYRLDLLVEQSLVLELKSVEALLPIHTAQLLSYLKLGGYQLGLLLNFNTVHLRDGIKRIVYNF